MRRGRLVGRLVVVALLGGAAWWVLGDDDAEASGPGGILRRRGAPAGAAALARAFGTTSLPAPSDAGAPVLVASGGAQLQLRVVLEGAAPAPVRHAAVQRDAACPAELVDSTVRTARDGGVVGALVWMDGAPAPRTAWRRPERRALVTFADCHPAPALQVVPPGTTLALLQRDSLRDTIVVQHAARPVADTIVFDADGQVVPLHTRDWPAGAVTLRSLRFPWSRALVLVAPNATARQTSDAGTATLDSLAPGERTVRAWHPRLGLATTRVRVPAGGVVTATLRFAAPR